jgi:hypothetical protein
MDFEALLDELIAAAIEHEDGPSPAGIVFALGQAELELRLGFLGAKYDAADDDAEEEAPTE